jgi:hypothetical protein
VLADGGVGRAVTAGAPVPRPRRIGCLVDARGRWRLPGTRARIQRDGAAHFEVRPRLDGDRLDGRKDDTNKRTDHRPSGVEHRAQRGAHDVDDRARHGLNQVGHQRYRPAGALTHRSSHQRR